MHGRGLKEVQKYSKYLSVVDRIEMKIAEDTKKAEHFLSRSQSQASTISLQSIISTPSDSNSDSMPVKYTSEIDELIEATSRSTTLDLDHLPARTQLARLYRLRGDNDLAEHWLQRACTYSKYRGASGGIGSVFSGATGLWGWVAWKLLAEILAESGRPVEARKAVFKALGLQKIHSIRGYDCLSRIF